MDVSRWPQWLAESGSYQRQTGSFAITARWWTLDWAGGRPADRSGQSCGKIGTRERLGGPLKSYDREAA